jgi:DNA adenine methylase
VTVIVPPIKCQGIKTKLVPHIRGLVEWHGRGRWVEPFCGSGVVALNVQPKRAVLADSNVHIIGLYRAIQAGDLTPGSVRSHLLREGGPLAEHGAEHYYSVRHRFNAESDPHDFLFLSRACFNGVMRFNRRGEFNVPFCHKPDRFSQGYITKIANQVRAAATVIGSLQWEFRVADFRATLSEATVEDFVYADPPYGGRHTDYYSAWDEGADEALIAALRALPCRFILSTWHHNKYRTNGLVQRVSECPRWRMHLVEHFYHVGSAESLRSPMTEALVTNYAPARGTVTAGRRKQMVLAV